MGNLMLKDFSKMKFDVLIQAGQSNAEGTGFGPAPEPYQPNDRVWYLNRDLVITPAAETVLENETRGDFSLSFARSYLKNGLLEEGRDLLILRSAVGGTGFLDQHWGLQDDHFLTMMEMIKTALALNPENRLIALLWHQGETDACLNASYDVHYEHLNKLLHAVTERFDAGTLPFIAGDFVQQWKEENPAICAPVVDAMRDVCRNYPAGAFVETDGLPSNYQELQHETLNFKDSIHFSRASLSLLGERYFEAFVRLRGKA